MEVIQLHRLKEFQWMNARLRKAVSDLTLDKLILNEALTGMYWVLYAAAGALTMWWTPWRSLSAGHVAL